MNERTGDATAPRTHAAEPLRASIPLAVWLIALPLAVAGIAMIPWTNRIYFPIYEFIVRLPLDEFFATTRQLPGATMLATTVALIWLFDPPRRPTLVYLLVAIVLSTAVNESIKMTTGRARPEYTKHLDDSRRKKLEGHIAQNPDTVVVITGKDQWLFLKSPRPYFMGAFASFPSGHALSAAVFAAYLASLYPRARVVWWILAVGCALSRVRHRRHYPEDAMVGFALGLILAHWAYTWHWPARIAERIGFLQPPNVSAAASDRARP